MTTPSFGDLKREVKDLIDRNKKKSHFAKSEIVQFKILPNFKFIRGPPQTFWTSLLPFL
ncbi:unnamed protein product, partial [Nesidiocoris tenuis]